MGTMDMGGPLKDQTGTLIGQLKNTAPAAQDPDQGGRLLDAPLVDAGSIDVSEAASETDGGSILSQQQAALSEDGTLFENRSMVIEQVPAPSAQAAVALDELDFANLAAGAPAHDEAESALVGGRCCCAMCGGGGDPGTYLQDGETGPETGNNYQTVFTDQQVINQARRYIDTYSNVDPWAKQTITWGVYFNDPGAASKGGNDTAGGFRAANQDFIDGLTRAFAIWDDILDVDFQYTANVSSADIRAGFANFNGFAYAYYPDGDNPSAFSDMWFNYNDLYDQAENSIYSFEYGTYGLLTLVHEIGHAMGLPHPGEYNAAPGVSITYENNADYQQDTRGYTVMSYFQASEIAGFDHLGSGGRTHYASTLQMHDMLALHNIYNPETNTRTGNDTYGYNSNLGTSQYNFASYSGNQYNNPVFTIYDAGGTDALNFSGSTAGTVISLVEGTFSSVMSMTNNIAIAHGTQIENAVGGSGADQITGNNLNNLLTGGAGGDQLVGGGGFDSAVYTTAVYASLSTPGSNTGDAAGDTYNSIENLIGSSANDTLIGDAFNNTLLGNAGTDTIFGLGGTDSINGGTGTDRISGGFGSDVLTGGDDGSSSTASFTLDGYAVRGFAKNAGGWVSQNTTPRMVADVTGDGNVDVVGFYTSGVYIAAGNGGGQFGNAFLGTSQFGTQAGWRSQALEPRTLADVNNDGHLDIVGFSENVVVSFLNNGSGQFTTQVNGFQGFGTSGGFSSQDRYPRMMADINNDGNVDIVAFGQTGVLYAPGNGSGQFGSVIYATRNFGVNGGYSSQDRNPRWLEDVNNDGAVDIVAFSNLGVIVALNKGNGFFEAPAFGIQYFGANGSAGGWGSDLTYPRYMADVNGDNNIDIVGFSAIGTLVSLGNGQGQFAAATNAINSFGTKAGGWTDNDSLPRMLADVNNDNQADVVGFGASGVLVALADATGETDTFVFAENGFGQDTITDWNEGDILEIDTSAVGFNSTDVRITQSGNDTVISNIVNSSTITLQNTLASSITTADDFNFV